MGYKSTQNLDIMSKPLKLNILLLGSSGVGKSTILSRYANRNHLPGKTIGIDVCSSAITDRTRNYAPPTFLKTYDMGGSRYYWQWISDYTKNANIVFLFYDVTNAKTLEEAEEILDIIKEDRNKFRTIIVGNKTDLESKREVKIFDVNKWIGKRRQEGWQLRHIECSRDNIISIKTILDRAVNGMKKIEIPLEFRKTDFNLNKLEREKSWSNYLLPW